MGKAQLDPLRTVNFHCRACGHRFEAEPDRVASIDDQPHHPWTYAADCPECDEEASQAAWERNLTKAWALATGPKTEEGLARCKFNALKHGLSARVATVFPARPGGYPQCEGCEHLATRDCVTFGGCLKRAELQLQHQIAFDSGNPSLLRAKRAETQAHLQALIDWMLMAIVQDGGPRIKTAEWYHDKDGGFYLAKYRDEVTGREIQIYRLEAHPLLKPLMDFISKNNMTLADLAMTEKVQGEEAILRGHLDAEAEKREQLEDYLERQDKQQAKLLQLINNSAPAREGVVIEGEAG